MESEWIEYYDDRTVTMPKSGFVEFINTFNPEERTIMNMSVYSIDRNLAWNRASPICVDKFRFITEQEFLTKKISMLNNMIADTEKKIDNFKEIIEKCHKRILEIS